MQVALVSPERILYEGEADMVIARTAGGDIAFLNNHAPFVGVLGIGKVRITPAGAGSGSNEIVAAVHGGFVEVKDNRVTILSDVAELADQIDVARAREALTRTGGDDEDAALARRRAEVRLEAAGAS
ncbi:MAG TPA: F0F1 ATP synthase subunit epsilon [Acidimicrobiales bacterium]|jgi:F-type H+-transporting ATPase subunit epsilon|nr:F0F1 ATP synthase subunit epsilon [Acidimicrobiales bacterium]